MKYWIGECLREFRVVGKFTQAHMGSVAGMCQSEISKMESGEVDPGFHATLKMLQHMRVPLSKVVDADGKPGKEPLGPGGTGAAR